MNKPQYQKLAIHYQKALRLRKRIERIENLLDWMRRQIKDDGKQFDVWITRKDQRRTNVNCEFTTDTFTKVMKPILKDELTRLRKQYKTIPPMVIKAGKGESE
jgi:hypothetical protein